VRTAEELWGLLRQAEQMPWGSAQIALLEQVLRHADASGDRELQWAARLLGTNAYVYGGEVAKSFVTFSWCLSDFDRNPAPFHQRSQHNLLWQFKYMVTALTKFPEVPLARTYAVLDDMERRYKEGGHSLQAVYKHRYLVAQHIGDEDAATSWYDRWNTTPRDNLSDCAGCDPSTQVAYLADRGRDEEAVALAEPVLAGRLTCSEQPQTILATLLRPYARTGRLEAAADAHRRSYRLMRPHLADLWDIGDHIGFCARTGNENRGLEILQRHIDWLDKAPSPAAGMNFAASSALLLRRMTELGHGDVTVHRHDRADISAAGLADELARFATELSLRFDARNGTTTQSERIAEELAAESYPQFVLSPSARRGTSSAPAPRNTVVAELRLPADPAELLDLGDELVRDGRGDDLRRLLAALAECLRETEPTPLLLGRQAELTSWLLIEDQGVVDQALAELSTAEEHYQTAGDEGRALAVSSTLGVLLAGRGDLDQGLSRVAANLAYRKQHPEDVRAHAVAQSDHGMILSFAGRHDEALAAQERAVGQAAELADPRLEAQLGGCRADALGRLGRLAEAVPVAEAVLEFYREKGPRRRRAQAAVLYGRLLADPAAQFDAFSEAIASGEPSVRLASRIFRAGALMELSRAGEAVDDYVEAVALATESGQEPNAAMLRHELAGAYLAAGRPVEAAEVAEEAVALLTRLGRIEEAANSRFMLAGIYRELGDSLGAITSYEELIEGLAGNRAGLGQIREELGDLLYKLDRDTEAAARYGEAAEDLHAIGDRTGEVRLLRRRVTALHWADDVPAAEETMRLATQRHAELPPGAAAEPAVTWERAVLCFEFARLLAARERDAEAVPYLTRGLAAGDGAAQPERSGPRWWPGGGKDVQKEKGAPAELLRSIGDVEAAASADALLGKALRSIGDVEAAEKLLRRLVDGLDPEAPSRPEAAYQLAATLDALGRPEQADDLRRREGIEKS
jgi:tetratricopeptide (TPR) repeat protein